MPVGIEVFKKHLREKRAIKLSLGSNIDANKTALIATCAQNAHASAIDIACDKKSFEIAKNIQNFQFLLLQITLFLCKKH